MMKSGRIDRRKRNPVVSGRGLPRPNRSAPRVPSGQAPPRSEETFPLRFASFWSREGLSTPHLRCSGSGGVVSALRRRVPPRRTSSHHALARSQVRRLNFSSPHAGKPMASGFSPENCGRLDVTRGVRSSVHKSETSRVLQAFTHLTASSFAEAPLHPEFTVSFTFGARPARCRGDG